MKINMVKQYGGVLVPASDMESEKLTKFKTGEMYEIDIKLTRNPAFHRKMFAFFNFCFAHWESESDVVSDLPQFDAFRKDMTVLSGYHNEYYGIDGSVRIEAKSLSYGSMNEEEFSQCYNALIQVAMQKIFDGDDQEIYNKLAGFF